VTTILLTLFTVGYSAIALEHFLKVNKAVSALLTGVFCWTIFIMLSPEKQLISDDLIRHVGDFSGILFFLLGAMTIVEIISAHNGFDVITKVVNVDSKRKLLWLSTILTFFISSALDNLTTTIVMISLLTKFALNKEERLIFVGMVVIAANAGGAWTPIGDVTSTMLWIGGRVTSMGLIIKLFLPSIVCTIIPLVMVTFMINGKLDVMKNTSSEGADTQKPWERNLVFFLGMGSLLFIPFFKGITHLPPFMGILLGLGVLWLVTEIIHVGKHDDHKSAFSVTQALRKIDMGSVLFFLGILTCIAALDSSGILRWMATSLNTNLKNPLLIDFVIGLLSAIVDNVPLVAGTMGMYSLHDFIVDHQFWTFLSYCAGTGGSILIIGSAAGVAAMGLANINFVWYLKKISLPALLGYVGGAAVFFVLEVMMKV
jgi:Na+/H+ antiporter NhaD/arsenite permease-like protein